MTISQISQNTVLALVLALVLASCALIPLANAEQGERSGRRGAPPQEALDACVGKVEGNVCSFSGHRGEEEGACAVSPRDEEIIACRPERHRPEESREDDAEDE